jgi:hypothetical protein
MQSTQLINVLLVVTTLLISCGDDSAKSQTPDDDSHSSHRSSTPDEGLRLDNGNRWKMDDHTRAIFVKMAKSFLDSDYLSLEGDSLKSAGSDLKVHVGELIRGCTMTGEAHDQLHVYLTGYIPAVAALSETGRIEDAKKVKNYLEIYDQYFE